MIGSISGVLDCHRYISSDGKRLVLAPVGDFALGERVDVTLNWSSNSAEWSFTVRPENPPEVPLSCQEENFFTGSDHRMDGFQRNHSGDFSGGVSVPLDFPELILNASGEPAEGNYFFGTLTASDATPSSYLIIADNDGEPVFYWHWNKGIFCVEVQPGGLLTFGTRLANNTITWLVLDDTYTFLDSFTVVGYPTDIHDITMRENGNALLIGVDSRYIDMSLVVPGGNPNALVKGLLVQEQDENHVPIFQWSSFDHFEITDAAHFVDLTAAVVDYVHCNSIAEDLDGNILLSCLALGECTKIDQTTGDIIWRFGGLDADSSWFTMTGDPLGGFSAQHDFNSFEPGLYTVFDNGRFHSPQVSRGLEYQLDTNTMTAELVWSYQEPGLYGTHMGSMQRLPDGNYIIGWGDIQGTTSFSDVTEHHPDGTGEHSMRFADPVLESYRVYKYDWEGQALVPYLIAEVDSVNNTSVLTFNVFGNDQFDLYRIWQGTSSSQLDPMFLTPERQVSIWALPTGWNYFAVSALDSNQVETGLSNIDSVFVHWTGIGSDCDAVTAVALLFPNPAVSVVNLLVNSSVNGNAEIDFFDITGRKVFSTGKFPVQAGGMCRTVAINSLPSGLYTVRMWGDCVEFTESLVILR
ncbi:MAG: aryl-sulfate sulfotransferase [Candidatus Sabulitectum sp.]|nr:aryl-sulfate sulfotransferase [Candidatus Sabulitectum sp.]